MARYATVTVSTDGAEQIDQTLAQLPLALRQRYLVKAMRKAVNTGAKETRQRVPKNSSGGGAPELPALRRSVKTKVKSYDEYVLGIVGTTSMAFHAHLVEFGHRLVRGGTIESGGRVRKAKDPDRTGKGRVVGEVAPHPFIRPAAEAMGPQAERILIEHLRQLVEDFAA